MKTFSKSDRDKLTERLDGAHYDLVVVGGGITGAGVARDAASRGMKVLVVEANDFASGTSSRSSKLIHGGIRYLENLEFGLVFEALAERALLFKMAPHCVHPLRFLLPIYQNSRVGMTKMGMGMWLYDLLALFEVPELHERLDWDETLDRSPQLRSMGLMGSYVYSDAYMDDDRLVIETLRSAVQMGADAISFVKASDAKWSGDILDSLELVDELTKKRYRVFAKHFVSAVGPWTDIFGHSVKPRWKKQLRPSKGIHLTLRKERFPLECAVVMAVDKEKRIIFAIPRHEMVIIGTTDTDFSSDPASVVTQKEDVEYLLRVVGEYFPLAKLTAQDVIASYAGVRPLVADEAETESKTSREHKIWSEGKNLTFVAGGKYTTYRRMAEDIVKMCLETFSVEDQVRFAQSGTTEPLNPFCSVEMLKRAADDPNTDGVSSDLANLLKERHGGEWQRILSKGKFYGAQSLLEFEVTQAVENGMCFRLVDFYLRRYPAYLSLPQNGMDQMEGLAAFMGRIMNWTDSEIEMQKQLLFEHHKSEQGWRESF
ncbi:MAG: glycerol-3-phosphate dehydrogenase/oxidase [Bdellovibrionales bacterium CG10_big_fil_rev_8_21_14_0_10_45_34]|nr:MAG: glycerol-3-phosphate dehydrogenase/oxidase [Bdellovibrionales bacterium CG10_big_fil_rev_8_21_14_0_10_45_34]